MPTSTHAPMLGTRTYFNGSNSDVSFGWWTPLGVAKAAERVELDHLVTDHFTGTVAPVLFPDYAESAYVDDDIIGDMFADGDDDGVDAVELVAHLLGDVLDPTPSPLGDTFDPDEVQWGFTVRNRF